MFGSDILLLGASGELLLASSFQYSVKALSLLNTPLEVLQKAVSHNTFSRIFFSGPCF